jgi:hypothetical protein
MKRMAARFLASFLPLILLPSSATVVSGQAADRVLSGSPLCPVCTLSLRRIALLGSDSDSTLLSDMPFSVGVLPGPRFLADGISRSELLLFDAAGRLRRVIGRKGQGPNEFPQSAKSLIPTRGDSIYVLAEGQAFVYTQDLREARRFVIPLVPHFTALGDGSIAWFPPMFRDSSLSLGIVSAEGRRGEVFNVRPSSAGADPCMPCRHVSMAPASNPRELWVLHSGGYRLQRWRTDGTLLEVITIANSPWRNSWLDEMRRGWGNPANMAPVLHVRSRPDGLLLVSAQGPSATPRSARAAPPRPGSLVAQFLSEETGLDQVFDIVDPRRGVLASTRVTQRGFLMTHDGRYVIRLVEASSGITQVEVWEVVFAGG